MRSGRRGCSRLDQRGSRRAGRGKKKDEQNPSGSARGRVHERGRARGVSRERARSRLRSSISPRVQSNRPPLVENELRGGDDRFPSEWRLLKNL